VEVRGVPYYQNGVIIALVMEAARTSETSVDIQLRTRQYVPEDSELHTRRRENLKSHTDLALAVVYIDSEIDSQESHRQTP
jgi:hypothetical protein